MGLIVGTEIMDVEEEVEHVEMENFLGKGTNKRGLDEAVTSDQAEGQHEDNEEINEAANAILEDFAAKIKAGEHTRF